MNRILAALLLIVSSTAIAQAPAQVRVRGTVEKLEGNVMTVKARNGQTMKVQLAANGMVRKQVDGQLSDIKQGDQIVAVGSQNGDTLQATNIQIGGGFGGQFGGGRGDGQNATPAPSQ